MDKERVRKFLLANRGYLKKGANTVSIRVFGVNTSDKVDLVKLVQQEIRRGTKVKVEKAIELEEKPQKASFNINSYKNLDILVVGDLHAPFALPDYIEWCYQLSKEYKTNKTIFIGDVIDSHSWSYHEHDVDGLSVGHELDAGIRQLRVAYKMFPEVDITLGNHDLLIARKAKTAGLSRRFIRDLGEVLEAPKTWNFVHEVKYHDVNYIHGTTGNAFTRAKDSRTSTVQGHLHSQAFVQYSVSEKDAIFGLQIGCGVDHHKYAFEYAKPMTKKPIISAGVVLENGTLPILRLMKL